MKLLHLQLLLSICLFMAACSDNNDDEPKITAHKEYEVIVASKQLLGVSFSSGSDQICKVYAVKKDGATDWESLSSIKDFEYEKGYEYRLKISETSYLDYRMGDPAWTEYKLMEVKSKEMRESEGLPSDLLPDRYGCIDFEIRYAIEAENQEAVENYLLATPSLFVCDQYVFDQQLTRFASFRNNPDLSLIQRGTICRNSIENITLPDSYKLIPLEGQITAKERWAFTSGGGSIQRITVIKDVFYIILPGSSGNGPGKYQMWMYQDVTKYLQEILPEAGVKTVVVVLVSKIRFNKAY